MDDDVPATQGGATARADRAGASEEHAAREHLLRLGADTLAPRPWQEPPVPPSAVDLVRYFLWWADRPPVPGTAHHDDAVAEAARAALRLLPAARAELDQLEVALLFTARGAGLTWDRTAQALGLASRQAGQQRLDRLSARLDRVDDPPPTASRGDGAAAGHATGAAPPDDGSRL